MSQKVFEKNLSEVYDTLCLDKPYRQEVDFLEEIFSLYCPGMVRTILDMGCGTGRHATELARRGYKVTGVDWSEYMIEKALERKKDWKSISDKNIEFVVASVETLSLDKKFDCAIMMFNVAGYVDLEKVLYNVYDHLRHGGLFIFDFWNNKARGKSKLNTIKKVYGIDSEVVREGTIKKSIYSFEIEYKYKVIHKSGHIDKFEENHNINLWSRSAIKKIIKNKNRFQLLQICPFLELNKKVNDEVWEACAILQKLY